jgi:hypothetical protein
MVVGDCRVDTVSRIVWRVAMMTDGSDIRRNGRGLDARKTGHATELLSRGFWGFELPVDVIRGRSGERERVARVWPCQRCADILLPEFAEVTDLGFSRGHSSGRDSP